jgi:hypothetical protein
MTIGEDERRKEALEFFIRDLQAAPDSFIKALSGKSYARELVDGAVEFKKYIFKEGDEDK